ncbi:MAG TPA: ABC transporter permease [Acidobacteriota bacterium]|nr:ABC transporter permease [Acidobacteriota bacterium]
MPTQHLPPRQTERLLGRCLPQGMARESIIGDLREEYANWRRLSPRLAKWRYRREALRIASGYLAKRLTDWNLRGHLMTNWTQDLRYAIRTLRRSPAFTVVAVITLALGIGATTAIFSLVDHALVRSMPVQDPETLVHLHTTCRRSAETRCSSSYPDFLDFRRRSRSLQDLAGYSWFTASLSSDRQGASLIPQLVTVQLATGNYFQLLGLTPHSGRLLQPQDGSGAQADQVAVLTHDFWRNRLGASQHAVGRTLRLNGMAFTVVGVAPPGFRGVELGSDADLWVPLGAASQLGGRPGQERSGDFDGPFREVFQRRGTRWIDSLVGRLAPGASVEQARRELQGIAGQLRGEFARDWGERSIILDQASTFSLPRFSRDNLLDFLWILGAAVLVNLLLTCANLANLMLARAAARSRETGIRLCLGAGRVRLMRQLMTESLLLALLGAVLGLAVSNWTLQLLSGYSLPGVISIGELSPGLDLRLFAFAAALALASTVLFGLVPALQSMRQDPASVTRSHRGSASEGASPRLRQILLAAQVGLCLVLMVGAALFLTTLRHGFSADLGFDKENLAASGFNLNLLQYQPAQARALTERLLEESRRHPGIRSSAVATDAPFQPGGSTGRFVQVDGYQPAADERLRAELVFVSPDYFRTLALPILQGRAINAEDGQGGPPVGVINRTMAQAYWPSSPLGGTIRTMGMEISVVGVTADTYWNSLSEETENRLYFPLDQRPSAYLRPLTWLARSASSQPPSDAETLLPYMREQLQSLDSNLAVTSQFAMKDRLAAVLMPQRMGAVLLSSLGGLALFLSLLGVYGIVSYIVSQRRREMGIRMALGATRSGVIALMMRTVLAPVAAGLLIGLPAALWLSRSARGFILGISPHDPLILTVCTLTLALIGALAAYLPAHHSTTPHPTRILDAD